jgi:hypothetical protein
MKAASNAAVNYERMNLRLVPEVFLLVDQARAQRLGNVSRNIWIAETIQEKLTREKAIVVPRSKPAQGGG